MESDAEIDERRNDVLSQSYIQGVERVAQQNNNDTTTGFVFDLPKEVLQGREKAWGSFFMKYREEVPDDIVLDIGTMEPVTNEQDEKTNENEDDNDEELEEKQDEQQKEYYSQCRGPMRKLPALIQYWVDTGNPPYQLVGEDDISETGSSLSEGEHSRSGQSAILREFSENRPNKLDENSPCSSVDTVAYILSNTNVTKKTETMAIVDASWKKSKKKMSINDAADAPFDKILGKMSDKNISLCSIEQDESLIVNDGHDSSTVAMKVTRVDKESTFPGVTSEKSVQLNNFHLDEDDEIFSSKKESKNTSATSQRSSVKLSEVLPAIQQFDEFMENQRFSQETSVRRSALSKVRRKRKPIMNVESMEFKESATIPQSLLEASSVNSSQKSTSNKILNRRKLYTGRNSPIDLIVATTSNDATLITGQSLHPALYSVDVEKKNITSLASQSRARRKRKRVSARKLSINDEIDSQNENTRDESIRLNERQVTNQKGHMRYKDFFQSLGLTPSKTILEKAQISNKSSKRVTIMAEGIKDGRINDEMINKIDESTESSIKESQPNVSGGTSDGFVFSPELVANSVKLLGNKIARVQVVRLSDKSLARYDQRESSSSSSPRHSRRRRLRRRRHRGDSKNVRVSKTQNIELLTTITHDSDSSTILICSCNNNNDDNNDNNNNNNDTNNDDYSESNCSFLPADSVSSSQDELFSPMEDSVVSRSRKKGEGASVATSTTIEESRISSSKKSKIRDLSKFQSQAVIDKTKVESPHGKETNGRNSKMKIREITSVEKSMKSGRAFVRLEKLCLENWPQLTSSKKRDIFEEERKNIGNEGKSGNADGTLKSCPEIKRQKDEDGNRSCLKDSSKIASRRVIIGSRIFDESSNVMDEEKINKNTSARRDVGFDTGMSSLPLLEEDDDFVKLLRQIGPSKFHMYDNEKNKGANQAKDTKRKKLSMPVKRRRAHETEMGITAMISSDEKNDKLVKLRRETETKRPMRINIDAEVLQRKSVRVINSVGADVMGKMENIVDEGVRSRRNTVDEFDDRRNARRRSPRKKLIPTQYEQDDGKSVKFASRDEGQMEDESNDENHGEMAQRGKKRRKSMSKETKIHRTFPQNDERINTSGLPRFKTKLDEDSDSDFEKSHFSHNNEDNFHLESGESIEKEISLLNCVEKILDGRRNAMSVRVINSVGADVMGKMENIVDEGVRSRRNTVDEFDDRRNARRRSPRKKLIPTQYEQDDGKSVKFASREEGQMEDESNDEKSHGEMAQRGKKRRKSMSKETKIHRTFPQNDERINTSGLPRFKTKLDEDSDSDFEKSHFSHNNEDNFHLEPGESIEKEISLPNCVEKILDGRRNAMSVRVINSFGADVMGNMENIVDEGVRSRRNTVDEFDDRRNARRRSPRKKLIPTQYEQDDGKSVKFASREEGQMEDESNDEKSHGEMAKRGKKRRKSMSKETKIHRTFPQNDERINTSGLPRFKTKLDEDSDSDFEKSHFSDNDEDNFHLEPGESIEKEISLPNCVEKILDGRRNAMSMRKVSSETSDRRIKKVSGKLNNCLPLEKKTHVSHGKMKKRNNKWKNESKVFMSKMVPCTSVMDGINGESRTGPVVRKKSTRRRVVRTPMEYEESDDGGESMARNKLNFSNRLPDENVAAAHDDDDDDDDDINYGRLLKKPKVCSKNLFANIADETIEGVDFIFGTNENSRLTRSRASIENLKFGKPPRGHNNFKKTRQSKITFRTRLAMESDEDNIL